MFFLLRSIEYPLNIHILYVPRIWVDFVCKSGGSPPLWQTSFKDSPLTFWLSSSPEPCPLAPQARRTMASCHFNLCTDLGVLDESLKLTLLTDTVHLSRAHYAPVSAYFLLLVCAVLYSVKVS